MKFKFILVLIVIVKTSFAQVTNEGQPKSWKLDLNTPKTIEMPAFNLKSLQAEDKVYDELKDQPYRFGFEHQVSLDFEDGKWSQLKNGDRIWLLNVQSKGAKTLNFLFDEYYLPKGAKLYFYNDEGTDLLGAYTSSQNREDMQFGTWLINGDNIWIEYYEPADVNFKGQLHISKVVHGYRSVNDIPELRKALNDSGPCNQDVDCPVGADFDQLKDELKKSVAMTIVGSSGFCSGALINTTRNDRTQYFLTANHCLGGSLGSWAFRFNWISSDPSCSSTELSSDGDFDQTASGATLLASNAKSDFALLEIDAPFPPDWDLVWAGWDRSGNTPNFTVGIHHPNGDIMKVARDNDSPVQNSRPFNGIDDMDNWFLDEWELGVTEPGSSGSPLFDQNGRIIGQLAGGAAACSGTTNNGEFDYYGRFDVSWDFGSSPSTRLQDWLDPDNSGVFTIDQFPPDEIFENDVELIINNIGDLICGDAAQPVFRIANRGINPITNAQLTYSLANGNEETISWSGNLQTDETDVIDTVSIDLDLGNLLLASLEISGEEDDFEDNNTLSREINNYQDSRFTTDRITFNLVTDNFASETSWELIDEDGNIIEQSSEELSNNTTYEIRIEVEEGNCYEFIITDSEADGICCGFGIGSYSLTTEEDEIIAEGGEFGSRETINFRINESEDENMLIEVYPNPVSTELFIETNSENDTRVKVYDIRGRFILEVIENENFKLDFSPFASGIYFVRLDNATQSIIKKIVKQ